VYGNKAFTVQAHPEFENDLVAGLATLRGRGVVPDHLLDKAEDQLQAANDNVALAQMISRFFKDRQVS
jgi:GMP synthase (glutamine-hydrolysing)